MAQSGVSLPAEFDSRRLLRRTLQIAAILAAVALLVTLAPGLGQVRHLLDHASPGWIVAAVALEVLSCVSYVVMFRPIFCERMSRRTSWELALSELGVGSLVPASGAAGLALGAWALRRGGMPPDLIGRRTVAFFVLKSAANFVAVAVLGILMAVGLIGPHRSLALTLVPALLAIASIVFVAAIPRLARRGGREDDDTAKPGTEDDDDTSDDRDPSLWQRVRSFLGRSLADGIREAGRLLRTGNPAIIGGSLGYWAFDNAVLWATFRALGESPPIAVILMGYLLGQLGGALPLPGGLGGIDGGLVGVLVLFGTPLAATAAAVLIYRFVLFWVPLVIGAPAFVGLRRGLNDPNRPDLCHPAIAGEVRLPAS